VKCPGVAEAEPNNVEMQQRVRSRQEMVNKWFKKWAILSTPYCHQLLEHQTVFGAIVVLTQLSFVLGWECWDLCLLATPPKQQTLVSVADMSKMLA
jgi:hypothetical protein